MKCRGCMTNSIVKGSEKPSGFGWPWTCLERFPETTHGFWPILLIHLVVIHLPLLPPLSTRRTSTEYPRAGGVHSQVADVLPHSFADQRVIPNVFEF